MALAGIAGLLVGFLAGWLWVDTGEGENTPTTKDDTAAVNLDDLNLEEAATGVTKNEKMATTTASSIKTTKPAEVTPPAPKTTKPASATPPTPATVVTAGENTIVVQAQTAGTEVHIAALALKTKSWVVIHDDVNGTPARILGAKRFDTGAYTSATIKVLRATETGKSYYAMIHSDSGDTTFDQHTDSAVTTSDGRPVMTRFETK